MNKAIFVTMASAFAVLLATSAFAMSATTIRAVTIRSGQGTNFPKLGMLKANTKIMVDACDGTWCAIMLKAKRAFIEERFLLIPTKNANAGSIFDRWGYVDRPSDGDRNHQLSFSIGDNASPIPQDRVHF